MYEPADPPLSDAQRALVESLSPETILAIDEVLLRNVSTQWRKVARVVGTTMSFPPGRVTGIPDTYYAERIRELVKHGLLDSRGDLMRMRYSEVRLRGERGAP